MKTHAAKSKIKRKIKLRNSQVNKFYYPQQELFVMDIWVPALTFLWIHMDGLRLGLYKLIYKIACRPQNTTQKIRKLVKAFREVYVWFHYSWVVLHYSSWSYNRSGFKNKCSKCLATLSHRQPNALREPKVQSLLYLEMCATLDYSVCLQTEGL